MDKVQMNKQEWEDMKQMTINDVDRDKLVDISTLEINMNAPVEERIVQFLKDIKNPFCFKVGKIAVKVSFREDGPSFEDTFESMLMLL